MADANFYLKSFERCMDDHNVKYTELDEQTVSVVFNLPSDIKIKIFVEFDENGEGIMRLVTHVGNCEESRIIAGLAVCNDLNRHYRWIKFYLDDENDLAVQCDAIIDEETAGKECYELLMRTVHIVDEVAPELKKALGI